MELTYRVRARNTASDSENKIHDDSTAASYGFRGGLVPGVTVYAYMTVPLVEHFGFAWLEKGSMQVKFHQPFYDGEEVMIRAEIDRDADPINIAITASREDGIVCASALATVNDESAWLGSGRAEDYPQTPLPDADLRPVPSEQVLVPGKLLGTLIETLSVPDTATLDKLDEKLQIYRGVNPIAHPFTLLSLANQILVRNYELGPWIHAASALINRSAVRNGETVVVNGQISNRFERKGHHFVVLELLLSADSRVVQQVRHTAIYQPRSRGTPE